MATPEDDKCPVDHKSREAWLQQARTAAAAANGSSSSSSSPSSQQPSQALPASHPPVSTSSDSASADSCPVDHNARQVWLEQAQKSRLSQTSDPSTSSPQQPAPSSTSWSSYIPQIPFFSSSSSSETQQKQQQIDQQAAQQQQHTLGTHREVSTIPRASSYPSSSSFPTKGGVDDPSSSSSSSTHNINFANQEQETGADAKTGNWIYPSEKMFFDAMKRKGHDPQAPDMRTVVPIHNAVNERAWQEIKRWEEPWIQGTTCQSPRLHSFSGLSKKLSPRARLNTLLGYQAPFDRHDWVVDRCGTEIEYVIDFYAGRPAAPGSGGGNKSGMPSFYLDVRPKLNSWEGVKMRAFRAAGLS